MLPGEPDGVGSDNPAIGKDTNYGLYIAAIAKNLGVPHVAIVTDLNHHASPMAWAMDQLLGKNAFISGFNQANKKWLEVAESFVSLPDKAENDTVTLAHKKRLMIAGARDTTKLMFEKMLGEEFDCIMVVEKQTSDVPVLFIDKKPDVVILVGELAKNGGSHDQTELLKTLRRVKSDTTEVYVLGLYESEDPAFIRLPVTDAELKQRLGLVSA